MEKEVWLREGMIEKLAGRENLRYAMNPMTNGSFHQVLCEGRSRITAAGRYPARADRPADDAVLRAHVDIPVEGSEWRERP